MVRCHGEPATQFQCQVRAANSSPAATASSSHNHMPAAQLLQRRVVEPEVRDVTCLHPAVYEFVVVHVGMVNQRRGRGENIYSEGQRVGRRVRDLGPMWLI